MISSGERGTPGSVEVAVAVAVEGDVRSMVNGFANHARLALGYSQSMFASLRPRTVPRLPASRDVVDVGGGE